MSEPGPRNSYWRKLVTYFVSQPIVTRFFSGFVARVDLSILGLTKGRFSPSGYFSGWPIVTLISIGAKSGQPHATPVMGIPDGQKIILVASNFGRAHNPAWYYNLKSHPDAVIITGSGKHTYRAHEASTTEFERSWKLALNTYRGFNLYRERASREVPIMVLEPALNLISQNLLNLADEDA
jgi:deazaflavin-dependent oxidoreductase (nitroreductase family)